MRYVRTGLVALCLAIAPAVSRSDEAPLFPPPGAEHELLERFAGEWTIDGTCSTGPDSEPMRNTGGVSARTLGGRWVVSDYTIAAGGEESGQPITAVQTIGYDPRRGKYVGSWTDSMQNHLWIYEGDYDAAAKTLTLNAEGPNFMAGGELTDYRDSYEFVSDDEIVMRSEAKGDDGEWVAFMTSTLRRSAK